MKKKKLAALNGFMDKYREYLFSDKILVLNNLKTKKGKV